MLFVDEFCGILVYIKFGADVTSQYVDTVGRNERAIKEYIKNQLEEDYTKGSDDNERVYRPVYG